MRFLRRVVRDLRSGNHLDTYIAITIGLVVAALDVASVVDSTVVSATTLGTLSLLAFGSLESRHQVDDLRLEFAALARSVTASRDVRADDFLHDGNPDFRPVIRQSRDMRFLGVTLNRVVTNNGNELSRQLKHGATVRMLLMDPDKDGPRTALQRCASAADYASGSNPYLRRIQATIDDIRRLAQDCGPGTLEVKLLAFLPAFGLSMFDPDDSSGSLYVEIYPHKAVGPSYQLQLRRGRDGTQYEHFARQFDLLWDDEHSVRLV
jgi:hypothetical protein